MTGDGLAGAGAVEAFVGFGFDVDLLGCDAGEGGEGDRHGGFVGGEAEFVGQVSVTVNAVGAVPSPDLILLFGRDRPHFDQTMETRTVFSVQITSISSKLRKETWHRREWYLWV